MQTATHLAQDMRHLCLHRNCSTASDCFHVRNTYAVKTCQVQIVNMPNLVSGRPVRGPVSSGTCRRPMPTLTTSSTSSTSGKVTWYHVDI